MTDQKNLKQNPELRAKAEQVRALKKLSAETGFATGRSVCAILAPLTPQELAIVALILEEENAGVTDARHRTK
jgi:hypothetical protein